MVTARYDGHADWYDTWWASDGARAMTAAGGVLRTLLPERVGLALDVGCGTGRHAAVLAERADRMMGVDLSADQLRHARTRLPVAVADGTRLPVASASVDVVCSVLTHTDVPDFAGLVREARRVLRPGGQLVLVGVHPCFVHPFAEARDDGVLVGAGYASSGWVGRTANTGTAVRARVGVHHLTLADLLTAVLQPGLVLRQVVEAGPGELPEFIGLSLDAAAT